MFYLQLTGTGITSTDLTSLAGDISSDWNSDIAGQLTADCVLTGVEIIYIPSVGNEVTGSWSGSHPGTSSHTTIPDASACYVVNWLISAYYRGGHPRAYVPGVGTVSVTNGSAVDPTQASNLAAQMNSFRVATNARTTTNITGVLMGTMSFQSGNAWRGTPVFRAYNGARTRLLLGSQRRRIQS